MTSQICADCGHEKINHGEKIIKGCWRCPCEKFTTQSQHLPKDSDTPSGASTDEEIFNKLSIKYRKEWKISSAVDNVWWEDMLKEAIQLTREACGKEKYKSLWWSEGYGAGQKAEQERILETIYKLIKEIKKISKSQEKEYGKDKIDWNWNEGYEEALEELKSEIGK